MKQNIKTLFICLGFVALGIYAHQQNAPWYVSWGAIVIFGCGALILFIAIIYQKVTGKPSFIGSNTKEDTEQVRLKDGRDYRVDVNDESIVLINKVTGETKRLFWPELTEVYVIAIDNFPIGSISYILHRSDDVTEIPTDTEGNEALLKMMQEKLDGFDNEALIVAMGMLNGFKKLWPKDKIIL